ncbi:MAG: ACP S-malonyltransferase [Candidatus Omnitrophica bacterium]|nr:ACP S-malonyltransferase [Candidatus Omnitrophota bacterium]
MVKYALLFPGQGAQFVGMGKELVENFPSARALFEEADRILGYPLSRICWEGPQEALVRTEHCQPALYVASLAAWSALKSAAGHAMPAPSAAAGLSLGEYTALAAAGVFSFADGLKLVRLRGQAMEEAAQARRGTMASVMGLELGELETICSEAGAQVANINAPGQIVISGTPESVQAASEKAKEKGAKRVVPLEVGGAFHSRLMEPASRRLQAALDEAAIRSPACQVMSNVTGAAYSGAVDETRSLLVKQLTHPVCWEACMKSMLQAGIQTFLEVGPGTVLKGLCRRIDPAANVISVGTADQVREAAPQLA